MELKRIVKKLREVSDKKVYCKLEDSYEDLYIQDEYESYRGSYDETSYNPTNDINKGMTAHEFADSLHNAIGELIIGYKGGEFYVDEDLPVAIAYYGCTGEYIADIIEESDRIFLKTMDYDDYWSHDFDSEYENEPVDSLLKESCASCKYFEEYEVGFEGLYARRCNLKDKEVEIYKDYKECKDYKEK